MTLDELNNFRRQAANLAIAQGAIFVNLKAIELLIDAASDEEKRTAAIRRERRDLVEALRLVRVMAFRLERAITGDDRTAALRAAKRKEGA